MTSGEIIKTHRLRLGLSQRELGEKVGVNKAAVQKWESGAVQNIKKHTIIQLSEIFGISPNELFGYGGVVSLEEKRWHCCPLCGQKLLKIKKGASCSGVYIKCKCCKKEVEIKI